MPFTEFDDVLGGFGGGRHAFKTLKTLARSKGSHKHESSRRAIGRTYARFRSNDAPALIECLAWPGHNVTMGVTKGPSTSRGPFPWILHGLLLLTAALLAALARLLTRLLVRLLVRLLIWLTGLVVALLAGIVVLVHVILLVALSIPTTRKGLRSE